jgi:hypothetical protein
LRSRGGELLLSNSLVFLLGEAGDGLDLSHPHYFFDLIEQVRRGIASGPALLRTASGNSVELMRCCNVALGSDLTLQKRPKPLGAPPACYADYFGLLRGTTERLAANAASAGRKRRYHLVAACSRGYDSTAGAALASLAGCREGVTFGRSTKTHTHPLIGSEGTFADDSGADSLRALGMNVTVYDRIGLSKLPGHPRAEFYTSPASTTDASTRLMEDSVRGSLFVSGRHGERYWGPTIRCKRRNLSEVDDCHLSGHALGEFRMRAGFLHFPAPYVGALHGPAIYRITHLPEMEPWKLGTGYYDRPIARRIAEEAGVPRENFGQLKLRAGIAFRDDKPESSRDFEAFLQSEVPDSVRRRLDARPLVERFEQQRRIGYIRTHYAHLPLASFVLRVLQTDRLNMLWNSTHLYEFHWGFEKIRHRYATSAKV